MRSRPRTPSVVAPEPTAVAAPEPTVVVAPDKFRGSLTAGEAASAIAAGVRDALPAARVVVAPVADGGEGTVEILAAHGAARTPIQVTGPLGEPRQAVLGSTGTTYFVEAAHACGLAQLTPTPRTALDASSYGVGQAILAAVDLGASEVVVALGGTATSDGGYGMAHALGFTVHDRAGRILGAAPGHMEQAWDVREGPGAARLADVRFVAATDVNNPLLGPKGTVRTYAPQKGADAAVMNTLSDRLLAWSAALDRSFGTDLGDFPGGGAAGGIAAALVALLDARITSGASLVLDLLGLPTRIQTADLVITGEGSLDAQSLNGKLPLRIARLARQNTVPVFAVTGRAEISGDGVFDRVGQIVADVRPGEDPFTDSGVILQRLTSRLIRESALFRT